jgi:hypothetical protein
MPGWLSAFVKVTLVTAGSDAVTLVEGGAGSSAKAASRRHRFWNPSRGNRPLRRRETIV